VNWICDVDTLAAQAVGLSNTDFALWSSVLTGALAWGFLATWLFMFGRLRSAGIGRRQQRLVWWFAIAIALLQIGLTMLKGSGIEILPCPWSTLAIPLVSVVFAAMAFGFHIEDGNKADARTFFKMVMLPVLGEFVVTTKWVVGGLLKLILTLL
jgi:hypothetical protein